MNITILNYIPHNDSTKVFKGTFDFELFILDRIDDTHSVPFSFKFHNWSHWSKGPAEEWVKPPEKRIKDAFGAFSKGEPYVLASTPKDEFKRALLKSLKEFITKSQQKN